MLRHWARSAITLLQHKHRLQDQVLYIADSTCTGAAIAAMAHHGVGSLLVRHVPRDQWGDPDSARPAWSSRLLTGVPHVERQLVGKDTPLHVKQFTGILLDRDCTKLSLRHLDAGTTPVRSVMTKSLTTYTVQRNAPALACLRRMMDTGVPYVLVLDDQQNVVGVLSLGDCLHQLLQSASDCERPVPDNNWSGRDDWRCSRWERTGPGLRRPLQAGGQTTSIRTISRSADGVL